MHHGSNMFCLFAACGLAVAVLLSCGTTGQAQVVLGGGNSLSGGLGGGGLSGSSFGNSGFGSSNLGMSSFSAGSGLSGNSFTGGSGASFSGGSFSGGSFSGNGGMGSYGSSFRGGNSLTGGVSQTNPFYSSYANPLQGGIGSNASFGTPLYGSLSGTSANALGSQGTAGSRSTASGGTASGPGSIYGALGIVSVARAEPPPVAAGVGSRPAATVTPLPASMQSDFEDLISRTDRISPATRDAVRFGLNGGTVVLRGNAASQADAHALESLIRFAPGVREVRNEMTWRSP
jgi:hypothetical protein